MIDWFYQGAEFVAIVGGLLALVLGLIGRLPSLVSLSPLALTALGLIIQAFITIGVLASGKTAKGDVIEFYGYLITALIVAVGAGLWSLAERSKFSTIILGAANLTVAIMLLRMWQIWFH
ncbi:MAG: hypothetical protein RIS31_629 [Actinomycetota bacterium]|jgi:hypothetical protein